MKWKNISMVGMMNGQQSDDEDEFNGEERHGSGLLIAFLDQLDLMIGMEWAS